MRPEGLTLLVGHWGYSHSNIEHIGAHSDAQGHHSYSMLTLYTGGSKSRDAAQHGSSSERACGRSNNGPFDGTSPYQVFQLGMQVCALEVGQSLVQDCA